MPADGFPIQARDLRFILFEHLRVHERVGWDREQIEMFLTEGAKFAREVMAPTRAPADRQHAVLRDGKVQVPEVFHGLYRAFCDQGWMGAALPEEHGGQGMPKSVLYAIDEMHVGASCSFHNYIGLTRACASCLIEWGSEPLRRQYLEKLVSGEWQGTMCLTEPGAGSDVGASRARAAANPDGGYQVSGIKSFITSGDHDLTPNHVHFVLARIDGAPEGTAGLTLFLVPKRRLNPDGSPGEANDVRCIKVEEKMGIHASATTTMAFGEAGRCKGFVIGEVNGGMKAMFRLMNEERVAVGIQGHALGAAMYGYALAYSKERIQGSDIGRGKKALGEKVPIIRHPDVRRMLMQIKSWSEASRAIILRCGVEIDLSRRAPSPEARKTHEGRVELLTPVCKAWCSEIGYQACSLALQVYGGYGYIAEYPAEQYLRDSRIACIYEGTNGIQAMDLVFRKASQNGGALLKEYLREVGAFTAEQAAHPRLGRVVDRVRRAHDALAGASLRLGELLAGGRLKEVAFGATPYLTAFGNCFGGYLLAEQAVIADAALHPLSAPADGEARVRFLEANPEAAFYDAKVKTAEFFASQVLPTNSGLLAQATTEEYGALDAVLA